MSPLDEMVALLRNELRAAVREELRSAREAAVPSSIAVPVQASLPGIMLTAPEVAERCHAHPVTVRAWIKSGRLRASKPARHYLVRMDDLDRFLAEKTASPETASPDVDDEAARILGSLYRRK